MSGRILVFGGWFGSRNIGDEAILIGIKNIFEKISPDIEFVVISTDPKYTKDICGVDAISPKDVKQIYKKYYDSELVLISGGTPIYDYGHLDRFFYHYWLPKLTKSKVVYFGISVKRIRSNFGKILVKYILDKSEYITVREPKTEKLLRDIGVYKKMILTGDSAFTIDMQEVPKVNVRNILGPFKVGVIPRILTVNYKKHFHDKLDYITIENLNRMIANVIDHLIELGYSVYFIPFHTNHYDDDKKAISNITKYMKSHNYALLETNHDPLRTLGIVGEMDLIIGLRFHSLVFSAIQSVPMISINYDTKIEGLMKLLNQEEFMCTPYDSSIVLMKKIDNILDMAKNIKHELKIKVNNIRNSILKSAKYITNYLK